VAILSLSKGRRVRGVTGKLPFACRLRPLLFCFSAPSSALRAH